MYFQSKYLRPTWNSITSSVRSRFQSSSKRADSELNCRWCLKWLHFIIKHAPLSIPANAKLSSLWSRNASGIFYGDLEKSSSVKLLSFSSLSHHFYLVSSMTWVSSSDSYREQWICLRMMKTHQSSREDLSSISHFLYRAFHLIFTRNFIELTFERTFPLLVALINCSEKKNINEEKNSERAITLN